ncbi:hypothetical protein CaCOL14_010983 [Colletotrichum acutatum]
MANHREKAMGFDRNIDNSLSPCLRLLFFLLGSSICTLFTLLVPFSPFYGTEHGNHGHSDTNLGLITSLLKDKFPCGRDAPTALSRGCKFESYTATWQPPQCFDSALDAEFRQTRPWKFYTSRNSTTELSWSDVEKIKAGQAWTTWEFHLYSCAFLWKKEVKIAHGLVSGTIDYHQCLDHALMQDYTRPKDHVCLSVARNSEDKLEEEFYLLSSLNTGTMRFTALTSVAILAATAIAAPAIQREEKRAFITDELDPRAFVTEDKREFVTEPERRAFVTEDKRGFVTEKRGFVTEDELEKRGFVTEPETNKRGFVTEPEKRSFVTEDKRSFVTEPEKRGFVTEDKRGFVTEDKRSFITEPEKRGFVTEDKRSFVTEPEKRGFVTEEKRGFVTEPEKRSFITEKRGFVTEDKRSFVTEPQRRGFVTEEKRSFITEPHKRGFVTEDKRAFITDEDME